MTETLKKLSDEMKAKLVESMASKSFVDLIAITKSAEEKDAGSFRVVASTADVDRQGESVNQAGWDLTFYKSNPIVLWAHDYSALPIGVTTSIEVKDGKLVAEGKFAPADANPFAQQVRKLYDLGMVNTTSVGFIPKEYDGEKSGIITKSELLEFSFVPVPANPYALRLNQIKELGIDVAMLKTKGLEVKEETEVVAPKTEEKGPVADQVNTVEMREQKYEKYCAVMDALDAFCTVYFDDATPVEDFAKLLTETITILQQVATTGGAEDDMEMEKAIAKMVGEKKVKSHKDVLVSLRDIVVNHFALGSVKLPEGDKGGKEIVPAEKRSNPSEALKEVNDFVGTRELLRSIDNSIGRVLENFNKTARS